MSINSIKFLADSIRMEGELPPEEQTTLVNETTTRQDPNIPETGEPVTPEPQNNPELPSSDPEVPPVAEPVELPAEVAPAEVEEVVTRVDEIVTQVEENGVDPTTMKFITDAWGDYLRMFGLKLPEAYTLKEGGTNIRAAMQTIVAFKKLKGYMKCFKR